jgi:hypothetical protein
MIYSHLPNKRMNESEFVRELLVATQSAGTNFDVLKSTIDNMLITQRGKIAKIMANIRSINATINQLNLTTLHKYDKLMNTLSLSDLELRECEDNITTNALAELLIMYDGADNAFNDLRLANEQQHNAFKDLFREKMIIKQMETLITFIFKP